jgi:hypothetical protein
MGGAYSTSSAQCQIYLLQQMRAAPTVTIPSSGSGSNQATFLNGSASFPSTFGSNATFGVGNSSFSIGGTGYSGLNSGGTSQYYASSGTVTISASAEL